MSIFGELKCLQVLGNFPLISFPRGFSFHLQPKFPCGLPLPTTTIPGDSQRNPRDFARWVCSESEVKERLQILIQREENFVAVVEHLMSNYVTMLIHLHNFQLPLIKE